MQPTHYEFKPQTSIHPTNIPAKKDILPFAADVLSMTISRSSAKTEKSINIRKISAVVIRFPCQSLELHFT
jgi:hypothetical protein